jgi:PAS domain-containing protein
LHDFRQIDDRSDEFGWGCPVYSATVTVDPHTRFMLRTGARRDEIGRLAAAFNTMAQEVQDARRRLEAQVRERTQALDALRESAARSRAIVGVAFDAVVMIDGRGVVKEFNPPRSARSGTGRATQPAATSRS